MKLKSLILAAFVATSCAAFAAETAPLTFNGTLTLSDAQQFGLATPDGSRMAWVKLGGEFDGFALKSYDAASKTLTLEKGGQQYSLSMADSKFDGSAKAVGTKATLADAQAVIDQLHFDKMIEASIEGQKKAMTRMAEQMAKSAGGKISGEEMAEHQKKVMDVMLESMNPELMKQEMAQIYSEVFTKEQLSGMSAFNTTEAGKALIERQPEVQQRLQELMMPRVMAAMPKIQKMGMEFAKERAAKAKAAAEAAGASAAEPAKPAGAAPAKP